MNYTTTQTIPSLTAIDAKLCQLNFFFFVKQFWHEVIPEEPIYNWHIEYLCQELQKVAERVINRESKEYDLIINIPPGTTKSTICTVMLPVWCWAKDPTIRTLTASYSSSLSTDHSIKSRDIIRSQKFKSFFPDIKIKRDQDGKTHYKNTKGGERYATSVSGTVTGFHAHLLVIDDPLNPKEASSEVQRANANSFMDLTLSTRKVEKSMTPTILVMQRLHYYDCTGNWIEKKGKAIKHICLPGEISKDVKPPELKEHYIDGLLDPVRLNRGTLELLKTDLGSYGYAGQIMQTPTPEGGGIWQKWFIPVPDYKFPKLDGTEQEGLETLTLVGTDWDLAYTEKETNSASAFCTAGKLGEKMYIHDIGFKWAEFPTLIQWMKTQRAPHYIEAKASGKSARQVLVNQGIPAIEVEVGGGDKIARAQIVSPYAEAGMIYVRESVLDKLYNDSKQGLLLFPNAHDDLNDALVQSINRLLAGHQIFVF